MHYIQTTPDRHVRTLLAKPDPSSIFTNASGRALHQTHYCLFVQLVRPTFSLVTVPTPRGSTRTDIGDMQLFDLAVLPWPPAETGLRFGLGPTFVFPTATSKFAGQGAWQAGPACAAVYTGVPRLLIGFLLQDPISFAHTSPDRPSRIPLGSNRQCSFLSARLVLAIRGCDMGVWVAPSFPVSAAAKFGSRSSDGSSRFASTELLCLGTVDGLSPKFANRIPRWQQLDLRGNC